MRRGGADRLGLGEAGVDVDQDAGVGGSSSRSIGEDVVGEVELVVVDEALRGAEGIELERLEALGDDRSAAARKSSGVRSVRYQPLA